MGCYDIYDTMRDFMKRNIEPFEPKTKYEKMLKQMLTELFPNEYHSRGLFGGLDYTFNKTLGKTYLQETAAEKWEVTTVTIRNNMKKVRKKTTEEYLRKYGDKE